MFAFAADVVRIVRCAQKYGLLPDTEKIRFLVCFSFSDAYGNSSLQPVLGLIFSTQELRKINFSRGAFTEFSLVELYQDVWRGEDLRYSQDAVQGYCKKYSQYSHIFCGRETY